MLSDVLHRTASEGLHYQSHCCKKCLVSDEARLIPMSMTPDITSAFILVMVHDTASLTQVYKYNTVVISTHLELIMLKSKWLSPLLHNALLCRALDQARLTVIPWYLMSMLHLHYSTHAEMIVLDSKWPAPLTQYTIKIWCLYQASDLLSSHADTILDVNAALTQVIVHVTWLCCTYTGVPTHIDTILLESKTCKWPAPLLHYQDCVNACFTQLWMQHIYICYAQCIHNNPRASFPD